MSTITVADLPAELFEEILKGLDQESCKNFARTCVGWKEFAERSVLWELFLSHINLVGTQEPWVETLLSSKRKYSKVIIDGLNQGLGKNRMTDIFGRIGCNIVQLSFFVCVFEDSHTFVNILKSMPKLNKLVMLRTSTLAVFTDPQDHEELPAFRNLLTLEIVESDYRFLKFFSKSQIKTFKIMSSMDGAQQESEPLIEFLASQKKIETLAIRSIEEDSSQLFKQPIMKDSVPFQLKKLSLLKIKLQEAPNNYQNLLRFMGMHLRTLEELELGRSFPDFIYHFALSKYKKLKSLRLMVSVIPKDLDFYASLDNNSVRTLICVDSPQSVEGFTAFKELIKHLPNVTNLVLLDLFDRDALQFIANNLKNLKSLSVEDFNGTIADGIQFQALSSLKIANLSGSVDWETFTKANTSITELSIKSIHHQNHLEIGTITQNLKLQILKIEEDINADSNFFYIIRQNCQDIKSIYLKKESIEIPMSKVADIPGLHFNRSDLPTKRQLTNGEFWNDTAYHDHIEFNAQDRFEEAFELGQFDIDMMGDFLQEMGIDDDWSDGDDDFNDSEDSSDNDGLHRENYEADLEFDGPYELDAEAYDYDGELDVGNGNSVYDDLELDPEPVDPYDDDGELDVGNGNSVYDDLELDPEPVDPYDDDGELDVGNENSFYDDLELDPEPVDPYDDDGELDVGNENSVYDDLELDPEPVDPYDDDGELDVGNGNSVYDDLELDPEPVDPYDDDGELDVGNGNSFYDDLELDPVLDNPYDDYL